MAAGPEVPEPARLLTPGVPRPLARPAEPPSAVRVADEACGDLVRVCGDLVVVSTRARLVPRGALLDQRNNGALLDQRNNGVLLDQRKCGAPLDQRDPPPADRVADEERGGVSRSGEGLWGLGRGLDTCPARSSRGTTRPAEQRGTTRPAEQRGTTRRAELRLNARRAAARPPIEEGYWAGTPAALRARLSALRMAFIEALVMLGSMPTPQKTWASSPTPIWHST